MNPVIWIFGRPGAGKTTLAKALVEDWPLLPQFSSQPLLLDSDEIRKIAEDEDYSEEGRNANIARLITMSQIAREQLPVVVCAVTPTARQRATIQDCLPGVRMIYLCASDALSKERGKPMWAGTSFEAPGFHEAFCMSAEWPTATQVGLIAKLK
jgi:adenylylsulfate kinase-like enzyme